MHLLKASVVCDILALSHLPVDGQVDARQLVGAVLVHDALGLRSKPVDCRIVPPLLQVAVLVELPALVVEAVGDLVTDHHTDPTVVQTFGEVPAVEEGL